VYENFGMSSKMSSKERVIAKLQPWEKHNKEKNIHINIGKKAIDGVVRTVMACNADGNIKQEFTEKQAFLDYLGKVIDSIEKQL